MSVSQQAALLVAAFKGEIALNDEQVKMLTPILAELSAYLNGGDKEPEIFSKMTDEKDSGDAVDILSALAQAKDALERGTIIGKHGDKVKKNASALFEIKDPPAVVSAPAAKPAVGPTAPPPPAALLATTGAAAIAGAPSAAVTKVEDDRDPPTAPGGKPAVAAANPAVKPALTTAPAAKPAPASVVPSKPAPAAATPVVAPATAHVVQTSRHAAPAHHPNEAEEHRKAAEAEAATAAHQVELARLEAAKEQRKRDDAALAVMKDRNKGIPAYVETEEDKAAEKAYQERRKARLQEAAEPPVAKDDSMPLWAKALIGIGGILVLYLVYNMFA